MKASLELYDSLIPENEMKGNETEAYATDEIVDKWARQPREDRTGRPRTAMLRVPIDPAMEQATDTLGFCLTILLYDWLLHSAFLPHRAHTQSREHRLQFCSPQPHPHRRQRASLSIERQTPQPRNPDHRQPLRLRRALAPSVLGPRCAQLGGRPWKRKTKVRERCGKYAQQE
jgi:hypothetical protein